MNAQSSMAQTARTMQTKKGIMWQEIDWKAAESYVSRLQIRIVKAVQAEKWRHAKNSRSSYVTYFMQWHSL